jgi:hypothetical protein
MTVAALPGNVRLRKFQIGKETTFGTSVPATVRLPGTYAPSDNPNVTFPTADTGTLDDALPPYRLAGNWGGAYTGQVDYDTMARLWAATLLGGVSPTGGGADKTWTFTPASTTQDPFEIFSGEWGDETTDQRGYGSGTVNHLNLVYPEDQSPVTVTADWIFSSMAYPQAVTGGLSVAANPVWMYAADTSLYIDSTSGGIGVTKLTNTMHGGNVDVMNNLDPKRFQNGSNSRFQLAGFGRGKRDVTATFTFAKSTVGIAEAVLWLNANPTQRYVALKTISPTVIATTSTPYSQDLRFSGYWTGKAEGVYGTSNTTNVLTCHGVMDTGLAYPIKAVVVCAATAL